MHRLRNGIIIATFIVLADAYVAYLQWKATRKHLDQYPGYPWRETSQRTGDLYWPTDKGWEETSAKAP